MTSPLDQPMTATITFFTPDWLRFVDTLRVPVSLDGLDEQAILVAVENHVRAATALEGSGLLKEVAERLRVSWLTNDPDALRVLTIYVEPRDDDPVMFAHVFVEAA